MNLIQNAVEGNLLSGFMVVNGISSNRFRTAEFGEAEQQIGYRPVSDAWRDSR